MRVGLPVPSFNLFPNAGPYPGTDWDGVEQTVSNGCCFEVRMPSSDDDTDGTLDEEVDCDVTINSGWVVAELVDEGGEAGRALGDCCRGENLGDTLLAWGDIGALVDCCWEEFPLPSVEDCRFLLWDSDLSKSLLHPSLQGNNKACEEPCFDLK